MPTTLGELDLETAAKEAAGNWQHFDCFCWHRVADLDDAEQWAVVYTHHRDSGLLDQSNADAIGKALEPSLEGDDVLPESHSHWAVGWIDGFAIRVFHEGQITEAFRPYNRLAERLADYPILDESDYSSREYEATLANIKDAAWRLKNTWQLPEGWESEVYGWLSDNSSNAIENRDDQGGYPKEEELEEAFSALGYATV